MEWVSSPIQYRCNEELSAIFRSAVPHGFQQHTSARHYLSMARSNIVKTRRENVRMKSYLYAIRPLLCCRWVLERNTQPPMTFRDLVHEYLAQTPVGNAVRDLINKKETQTEADTIPKDDLLDRFISNEFDNLVAMCPNESELPDVAVFDDAFRRIVAKV